MTGPDDRAATRQALLRATAAERRARDAEAQLAAGAARAAGDMNALIRAAARGPKAHHDPAPPEAPPEPVGQFTPGVREALPQAPDMNALIRAARYYPTEPAP